ncbi:MAG: hypothetical protein V4612_00525 [Pseudomonadota bacterium]
MAKDSGLFTAEISKRIQAQVQSSSKRAQEKFLQTIISDQSIQIITWGNDSRVTEDPQLTFEVTYGDNTTASFDARQMLTFFCYLGVQIPAKTQLEFDAFLARILDSDQANEFLTNENEGYPLLFLAFANENLPLFSQLVEKGGLETILATLEFLEDCPESYDLFLAYLTRQIPGTNRTVIGKLYEEKEALKFINLFAESNFRDLSINREGKEPKRNIMAIFGLMIKRGIEMDLETCLRVILSRINDPNIDQKTAAYSLKSFYIFLNTLEEQKIDTACVEQLIAEGLITGKEHLFAACKYGSQLITETLLNNLGTPLDDDEVTELKNIAGKKTTFPIIKQYQSTHAQEINFHTNIRIIKEAILKDKDFVVGIRDKNVVILFDNFPILEFKEEFFQKAVLSTKQINQKLLQPIKQLVEDQKKESDIFLKKLNLLAQSQFLDQAPGIFSEYVNNQIPSKLVESRIKSGIQKIKEKLKENFSEVAPNLLMALKYEYEEKDQADFFEAKILPCFQQKLSDPGKAKFDKLAKEAENFGEKLAQDYQEKPHSKIKLDPKVQQEFRLMREQKARTAS